MPAKAIVCDSSVIRGMSNDPRNICYHYRHHLTGKQVYHCELSHREVVDGLMTDRRFSQESAEAFFTRWKEEFKSELLPLSEQGIKAGNQIQARLTYLEGLIPEKTVKSSYYDCLIAGETVSRKIPEIAAHDRDFLFIEIACTYELRILMLEMTEDGHPRQRRLSSQHRQRLEERLESTGIDFGDSVTADG